jgi:hypothetical protein
MANFELSIHTELNTISAMLLFLIGIMILLKNKNNKINQFFSFFFFGLAIYELFDGFTVAFRSEPNLNILNGFHDIALIGLILGIISAFVAISILNFGESATFIPERILLMSIIVILALVGAIFGDIIPGSTWHELHQHYHVKIDRSLIGILSISGFILIGTIINIYLLVKVFKQVKGEIRSKMFRLISGFGIIMTIVMIFDLSIMLPDLTSLITSSDLIHGLLHVLLFSGEILVLSSFWTPIGTPEPTYKPVTV